MRSSRVKKAKTAKYDNSRKDKQQDLEKALEEWDERGEDWLGEEILEETDYCDLCGWVLSMCECEEEGEEQ